MTKKTITLEQWLTLLESEGAGKDPRVDGWKPLEDLAAISGLSCPGMFSRLRVMTERGKIETKLAYDPTTRRQKRFYRPKMV